MKLTLSGLFVFVLYGLTTGQTGVTVHIYVTTPMTCTFAQRYCKELYTNLSIVSTKEDLQMLEEAAGGPFRNSWIYSQGNSFKTLKNEGTSTSPVQQFYENIPFCAFNYGVCLENSPCSSKFPFFCSEKFILVQEKKTWEGALEYCRSHYTDLASFSFIWPVNQIKRETSNTQTDSVWTSLHFLSGNWYWMSVKSLQANISLPSCPPEPYRCGARNTKKEQWENRDCMEKLNFLCLNK